MKIRELLAEGTKRLRSPPAEGTANIDTPALDAALLLAEVLQTGRAGLIVKGDENAAENTRARFFALLERRMKGECTAYILGRREFRGLEFCVNPGVLVPRPDTETLVEAALLYIDALAKEKGKNLSLLDLCTGSGALAVSLKHERPFLDVSASDISAAALETSGINAVRLLKQGEGVLFVKSDLFENIESRFDIIVSNPPYVPSGLLSGLAPEVQREPVIALDGGADGLSLIRKIVPEAQNYLISGGALLLEADPEQMPALRRFMEECGFNGICVHPDLAGKERVVSGTTIRRDS